MLSLRQMNVIFKQAARARGEAGHAQEALFGEAPNDGERAV